MTRKINDVLNDLNDIKDKYTKVEAQISNNDDYTPRAKHRKIDAERRAYHPKQRELMKELEHVRQTQEDGLRNDAYSLGGKSSTSDKITFDKALISFNNMPKPELAKAAETVSSSATARAIGKVANRKGFYAIEGNVYGRFESLQSGIDKLHQFQTEHGSKRSKKKKFGDNLKLNNKAVPSPQSRYLAEADG